MEQFVKLRGVDRHMTISSLDLVTLVEHLRLCARELSRISLIDQYISFVVTVSLCPIFAR